MGYNQHNAGLHFVRHPSSFIAPELNYQTEVGKAFTSKNYAITTTSQYGTTNKDFQRFPPEILKSICSCEHLDKSFVSALFSCQNEYELLIIECIFLYHHSEADILPKLLTFFDCSSVFYAISTLINSELINPQFYQITEYDVITIAQSQNEVILTDKGINLINSMPPPMLVESFKMEETSNKTSISKSILLHNAKYKDNQINVPSYVLALDDWIKFYESEMKLFYVCAPQAKHKGDTNALADSFRQILRLLDPAFRVGGTLISREVFENLRSWSNELYFKYTDCHCLADFIQFFNHIEFGLSRILLKTIYASEYEYKYQLSAVKIQGKIRKAKQALLKYKQRLSDKIEYLDGIQNLNSPSLHHILESEKTKTNDEITNLQSIVLSIENDIRCREATLNELEIKHSQALSASVDNHSGQNT